MKTPVPGPSSRITAPESRAPISATSRESPSPSAPTSTALVTLGLAVVLAARVREPRPVDEVRLPPSWKWMKRPPLSVWRVAAILAVSAGLR